jgi:hypothetical protein
MRGMKPGLVTVLGIGLLAGSGVGVTAQGSEPDAEAIEPVPFTAVFIPSSQVRFGSSETVDGVVQRRGDAWTPIMSGVSDPRMDGTLTYSEDDDAYPGGHHFATVTYRIVNDDGAWQGSTPIFKENGEYSNNSVVLLVGEGAYEGLYAWMDTSAWDAIKGVIFAAPPPEAPVPPELP